MCFNVATSRVCHGTEIFVLATAVEALEIELSELDSLEEAEVPPRMDSNVERSSSAAIRQAETAMSSSVGGDQLLEDIDALDVEDLTNEDLAKALQVCSMAMAK